MSRATRLLASTSGAALLLFTSYASASELAGRVSDASEQVSFSGAKVLIEELNRVESTGFDGRFRFGNVAPGTYTITVTYVGAEPVTQQVVVGQDGTTDVAIQIGENVAVLDNILVIGQAASTANALNRRRSADNLVDALTADNIGNFPDQNVSEAARRIVGLSVENDQGEGRYVVIRGANGDFNATNINGLRIGAPETDVRRVALDVIPSDLVSAIEVSKSVLPDMDGDAVGGTIDIQTASAFEKEGMFITARAEGSYSQLRDRISPRFSGGFSNTFALGGDVENFGVAISASYFNRFFGSENKEVDGGFSNGFPDELEFRDYDVTRERLGIAANFDYRPSTDTDFFATVLYSDFSDYEWRNRTEFKVEDDPFSVTATSATFDLSDGTEFEIDRDSKDRLEEQTIWAVTSGFEHRMDAWTFNGQVGYSKGSEAEPGRIDAGFRRTFGDGADEFFNLSLDFSDNLDPTVFYNNEDTRFIANNPAEFEFDDLVLEDNFTEEEEWSFKLDAAYDTDVGDIPTQFKFGAKLRLRDKFNDANATIYDGFAGDLTLADVVGDEDYALDFFGPTPNQNRVRDLVNSSLADFEIADEDTTLDSQANDYDVSEDIYAGYAMARFDLADTRITGGVRIEHTSYDTTGNRVNLNDGDLVNIVEVQGGDDYTNMLPSFAIRHNFTDSIIGRLAGSRTIARPNISDLTPRIEVEETEDGEIEGSGGNPDLTPYKSWNIDASVEYYPTRLSIISAGLFYKDITDFIVNTNVAGQAGFEAFDELIIPINGQTADIFGIELGYQQQFDFLPSPLDGIIVGANFTYVDSSATLDEDVNNGREITFPGQSEKIWNANIGYEKGPVSFRAAFSFRDDYLDSINEGEVNGVDADRFVKDHLQIDLSAKYQVTDQFQIYADMSNVSDEPFIAYFQNERFLSQYEEYDWTFYTGVRFTY